MSFVRPLPEGTPHTLSDEGTAFLPPFVRARMKYLADSLEWDWSEEENTAQFTYYKVRGKLSDGHYTIDLKKAYISPLHIWIASDDNCNRSLSIGGSASWLCPDSHYLYFDEIDPTLLPAIHDVNVWWCIQYEEDIKVIKILVCPAGEITEDFPDGV